MIKTRFNKHFELEQEYILGKQHIDLYAKYYQQQGRTFISKVDVIDAYHTCEEHYFKEISKEEEVEYFINELQGYCKMLKTAVGHMSTAITGIIIADKLSQEAITAIQKYRHSKNYCFGMRGWGEIRLVGIALDSKSLYTNKAVRKHEEVYKI